MTRRGSGTQGEEPLAPGKQQISVLTPFLPQSVGDHYSGPSSFCPFCKDDFLIHVFVSKTQDHGQQRIECSINVNLSLKLFAVKYQMQTVSFCF